MSACAEKVQENCCFGDNGTAAHGTRLKQTVWATPKVHTAA